MAKEASDGDGELRGRVGILAHVAAIRGLVITYPLVVCLLLQGANSPMVEWCSGYEFHD